MKRARHRFSEGRGSALVIVLSCLVLIAGLMVAFLASMQSRLVIARSDLASGEARLLADAAVNVVIGQIQNATRSAAANQYAWASQPGMIRTFNSSGTLVQAYKLYSAETMVTNAVNPAAELAALANWNTRPALFTDLNAPRGGVYPIVHPGAAEGTNAVVGFEIGTPPGSAVNPAAMPGRWLYMLRDGTLSAPAPGTSDTIATVPGASSSNPIVGRIAFWTDDESSRVNINTAAGDDRETDPGSYWDVPLFDGTTERNLSTRQPVNAEYQRYPGHPATVSLSTVFPELTRAQIYAITPRVADGGSTGGTITTTAATAPRNNLDEDRLYASVDELVFNPDRNENPPLQKDDLEKKRFFLTATSRAPEVTLFGTPRISLWPVHANLATDPETPFTSAYDRLAAFCSTFGGDNAYRYYFQRKNADSPSEDFAGIERNQQLYSYLQGLTSRPFPGFAGTLLAKYPQPAGGTASDRDQILTQTFDYIRSTNLFDATLGGDFAVGNLSNGAHTTYPAADSSLDIYQFTDPHRRPAYAWPGHGQVAPITIGNTKGFGRSFGIAEVAVHIICVADGNGLNRSDPGSANDHRTVSNLPETLSSPQRRLKNAGGETVGWTHRTSTTDGFPANRSLRTDPANPASAVSVPSGQRRLQAVFLVKILSPSVGFPIMSPDLLLHASGLQNLNIGGVNPFPPASAGYLRLFNRILPGTGTGGGTWNLFLNSFSLTAANFGNRFVPRWNPGSYNTMQTSVDPNYGAFVYQWVSDPFNVSGNSLSFGNPGADITIKIYAGNGIRPEGEQSLPPSADGDAGLAAAGLTPASLIQTLNVRFPQGTIPVPDLLKWSDARTDYTTPTGDPNTGNTREKVGIWWGFADRFLLFRHDLQGTGLQWAMDDPAPDNSQNRNGQNSGSFLRIDHNYPGEWTYVTSDRRWPVADYSQVNNYPSDVVRSLVPPDGDARLIFGRPVVNHDVWQKHPDYDDMSVKLAHTLATSEARISEIHGTPGNFRDGKLVQSASHWNRHQFPNVPPGITSAEETGDWDNGLGSFRDGPYINMPDEGSFYPDAYFSQSSDDDPVTTARFSPNRIIHSAGQFGSLPTGVHAKTPWQTLLFRPQPGHPQSAQSRPGLPPDHLLMDLFTMPAVEPYAISEPFSTAGRVNMNYQILPYTYIHRSTALRAALDSERVTAVPTTAGPDYKRNLGQDFRFKLNMNRSDGTLRQFEERFNAGHIFRSATEVCDIYLTPENQNWADDAAASSFWNTHKLTGDNARERPYARLYSKLTTRSNSYQVYYRVQALQKTPTTAPDVWDESRDRVTSDQRGSATLERYLDPNDETLPDHASNAAAPSLDSLYRFRILARKIFDN